MVVTSSHASVVIPAKNEEKAIGNVLMNLAEQTVKPEVIVVDSNSEDKTARVARDMGARTVVLESTIGMARHIGTVVAKGDVILQTDADAKLPEDWVESHLRHYNKYWMVTGPIIQPKNPLNLGINLFSTFTGWWGSELGYSAFGANMSYLKKRYVGFEDRMMCEDGAFLQKFVKKNGLNNHIHDLDIQVEMPFDYLDWANRALREPLKLGLPPAHQFL